MKSLTVLLLAVALTSGLAPGFALAAEPPSGTFRTKPVGTPLGTGKMVIEVTLVVGGKKVPKTVEIPSGDIKAYVMPKRMLKGDLVNGVPLDQDEPLRDYAQRVLNAQGEASFAKAKVIADAINTAYQDEFNKLPDKGASVKAAPAFITVKNQTIKVVGTNIPGLEAPFGQLVIPKVLKSKQLDKTGQPLPDIKFVEGKILGEGGNGGGWDKPPVPATSPGTKVSFEDTTPGVTTLATGIDPLGDPSVVELGIDGVFVAQYTPRAGDTDEDILAILEAMLDANGIPASFDPALSSLMLDMPLPDGQTFVWGNTDTGLEFQTSFAGLDETAIPEAPSLALVLIGLLAWFLTAHSGHGRAMKLGTC